jgi:hypothetical protein
MDDLGEKCICISSLHIDDMIFAFEIGKEYEYFKNATGTYSVDDGDDDTLDLLILSSEQFYESFEDPSNVHGSSSNRTSDVMDELEGVIETTYGTSPLQNYKEEMAEMFNSLREVKEDMLNGIENLLPISNGSGFEDDPRINQNCTSNFHEAPNMIVIPQGKRFKHVCPDCGHIQYVYPNNITF